MKIFCRPKKRIAQLEHDLCLANLELKKKNKEVSELRSRINGDRVCGKYCAECKHSYVDYHNDFGCLLGSICKDFEQKDDNK